MRARQEPCLVIRPCRRADLRALEWGAALRADRPLIEWVFARTAGSDMVMLIATIGRDRIGQVWLDFTRKPETAVLWALRVKPSWRGRGIGTLLIAAAEREARRLGARFAELAVEDDNPRARRLYERLGYRRVAREAAVDAVSGVPLGFDLEVLQRRLDGARLPVTGTRDRGARRGYGGTRH